MDRPTKNEMIKQIENYYFDIKECFGSDNSFKE